MGCGEAQVLGVRFEIFESSRDSAALPIHCRHCTFLLRASPFDGLSLTSHISPVPGPRAEHPSLMHTHAPTLRLLSRGLALILGLASFTLAAADKAPRGFCRFQIENDMGYSDRNYTQGMRYDRVFAPGEESPWVREILSDLRLAPQEGDMAGWYIGQLMFTPGDLSLENPPPTDRPYAGWLFLGVQRMSFGKYWRDTVAVSLGVTGKWSLAEHAQSGWHYLWREVVKVDSGFVPIEGWDTQMPTEPTLDIFLERKARVELSKGYWQAQLLPYANANIGTVFLAARAGATLRAGYNLPNDHGSRALYNLISEFKTTAGGSAYSPPTEAKAVAPDWGLHGFVTFEGKAMGRNLFLDGTLFRNSRSIDKETILRDFIWGIGLSLCRFHITYSHVRRGREFTGQDGEQVFHSIAFTAEH
jgi:lipid A 3-O-deacylase